MFKILVFDDDKSLRRILEFNLSEEGFEVSTAEDGVSALEALKAAEFDLLLTDIQMPGLDGMELLRKVKAQYPQTEVIMITAFGTIESAVEAMRGGAVDYLTKPVDLDRLRKILGHVGRNADLRHEIDTLRGQLRRWLVRGSVWEGFRLSAWCDTICA